MSPELLFGKNSLPSQESDIYALGMVIYEVSWLRSSLCPSIHSQLGPDWPHSLLLPPWIYDAGRCAGGGAPKKAG